MQNETKTSGIYCIENIVTNKKYIGQQINMYSRWQKHISELNRGIHFNSYLQNAWNKYGIDAFKFYVLEYCSSTELDIKESHYIEYYNTLDRSCGYNLKSGGQSHNYCADDAKMNISKGLKRAYSDPQKREKQRENALKQWANPEIKKKICGKNNAMYEKHHTEEAKRKISEARKGNPGPLKYTSPVLCIELNRVFQDAATAGKEMCLDSSCILKVCRKERKTCGGYTWEFVNIGK